MKLYDYLLKLGNSCYGLEHIANQFNSLFLADEIKRKKKLWNLLFDVLLGITFCIVFTHLTSIEDVTNFILVVRTMVKNYLEEVLKWLMGVPAGLKLNHELSSCMGHFFLYHVYIWMSYLVFLEEFLSTIATAVVYTSCFGLSCFLSFVNDSITLLTFHIYCFYAYAAKIYHLQLQGLLSLARLFMGKKWNVLRLRVDSITYDADQLILGTVLFTILLFLLPTTLLYYIVFAMCRIVVLLIQDGIYTAVYIITKWPAYDIFVKILDRRHFVTDVMTCDVVYEKKSSSISCEDQGSSSKTFQGEVPHHFETKYETITFYELINNKLNLAWPNVLDICKKLFTGVVVKPWNK